MMAMLQKELAQLINKILPNWEEIRDTWLFPNTNLATHSSKNSTVNHGLYSKKIIAKVGKSKTIIYIKRKNQNKISCSLSLDCGSNLLTKKTIENIFSYKDTQKLTFGSVMV